MPLRWTGPSPSCRKTCGPNTCSATTHPIDWAPAFAASPSSCAIRLAARVTPSAIGPGITPPHCHDLSCGPPTDPASKPSMRFLLLLAAIFLSVVTVCSPAQEQRVLAQVDSDQDGMSD